jgi:hypothetical protein
VSPSAALLLAHLCIGRPSHPIGLVELDADYLRPDLRDTGADVDALVRELESADALAVDWPHRVAYVVGWCMDDEAVNPSQRTGRDREARIFPDGVARDACLLEQSGIAWHRVDTVPTPCPHGVDIRVQSAECRDQTETQTITLHSVAAPQATLPGVDAGKVKPDKPDPKEAADALIAAYNAACPSMPRALLADGNRKAATAALHRAPLDVWAERFARAERSDLLAGRKTDWRASFVWLLKPANVLKLDEGQYDTRPDGSKRKSNNAPSEPIGHFDTVFPWDEVGS